MSDENNSKLTETTSSDAPRSEATPSEETSTGSKTLAPVAIASFLLGLGVFGAVKDTRLPVYDEYQYMNICVNGDERLTTRAKYKSKEKFCACIYERAVDEIASAQDRNDDNYGYRREKIYNSVVSNKIRNKCSR